MTRIFVSAGHSPEKPGAAGPGGPRYPFNEADLTLELRDLVVEALSRRGFSAETDGRRGESLSGAYAANGARGATLALDIHFNAGGGTGVECFGLADKESVCSKLSRVTATVLGLRVRGRAGYKHPSESQHPSLGFCDAGGVLLEICFMSPHDLDRYLPRKNEIATALAAALVEITKGDVSAPADFGRGAGLTASPATRSRPVRTRSRSTSRARASSRRIR